MEDLIQAYTSDGFAGETDSGGSQSTSFDLVRMVKKERRQGLVTPQTSPLDDGEILRRKLEMFASGDFISQYKDPKESKESTKPSSGFLKRLRSAATRKATMDTSRSPDSRSPTTPGSYQVESFFPVHRVPSTGSLDSGLDTQISLEPLPKPLLSLLNPSLSHNGSSTTLSRLEIPSPHRFMQYKFSPTSANSTTSDVYSEYSGNPLSTKCSSLPNSSATPSPLTPFTPFPSYQRTSLPAEGGGEWRLVPFVRQELRGRHVVMVEERAWDYIGAEELALLDSMLEEEQKSQVSLPELERTNTRSSNKSKKGKNKTKKPKVEPMILSPSEAFLFGNMNGLMSNRL